MKLTTTIAKFIMHEIFNNWHLKIEIELINTESFYAKISKDKKLKILVRSKNINSIIYIYSINEVNSQKYLGCLDLRTDNGFKKSSAFYHIMEKYHLIKF